MPLLGILIACLLTTSCQQARATEKYAVKEGRACGYCHTSGSPGTVDVASGRREPVDLNKRGVYYGKNNHSLAGYVDTTLPSALPPPLFRFIERIALPDSARRMAVAAVAGDPMPRLVTLNEKPDTKDSSVLTVQKWDGKAFITEFHAETPGAPDQLAVGKFTTDGKAVILTARTLWYWNGKTYVSKVAAQAVTLMGSVRYRADGSERALILSNTSEMWEYRVDINVPSGGNYLVGGTHLTTLPAAQVTGIDMHNTPEGFEKLQLPQGLTTGGIMGLMTARKTGKLLLYHVDLDQDIDVKNNGNPDGKPKFILKSQGWKVGIDDPREPTMVNRFYTPRLAGDVYDVATESIYGDGASSILILTSEGPDKKGRSLYSYTMNARTATVVPTGSATPLK